MQMLCWCGYHSNAAEEERKETATGDTIHCRQQLKAGLVKFLHGVS